ncbi:hypothetical protein KY328_00445 [Candidatus Woesearchaeota archaeon]|nr:hypothetical protein [Candidatus Woesearchaeota archaeon]MBW3021365.1 hypothetical protein [Candidatus Woesearchaeota archaeon]
MRRAQGLPLNVIIIAVLVLIVAVVVSLIFVKYIRQSGQELVSCSLRGGECKSTCDAGSAEIKNTDCGENTKCCVKVLSVT